MRYNIPQNDIYKITQKISNLQISYKIEQKNGLKNIVTTVIITLIIKFFRSPFNSIRVSF